MAIENGVIMAFAIKVDINSVVTLAKWKGNVRAHDNDNISTSFWFEVGQTLLRTIVVVDPRVLTHWGRGENDHQFADENCKFINSTEKIIDSEVWSRICASDLGHHWFR